MPDTGNRPAGREYVDAAADQDARPSELRAEIDRLRLENQKLYEQIADMFALGYPVRALASQATRTMRRVASIPKRLLSKGSDQLGSHRATSDNAAPYRVQHLYQAPQAGRRSRIVHVIANFYLGGSSRLVVDLFEHLGYRFEQSVITWDIPTAPAYLGISVQHEPRITASRALKLLLREQPDLLHLHFLAHHRDEYSSAAWNWYRHWFAAAECAGVPILENVNIPTEPYISPAVACYVYVSDYVRHYYSPRRGRHVTIHPGSDLARFSRQKTAPAEGDCIGMVYRLEGDKLDERAIEPFIEAVRHRPRTRALIVGGGRFLDLYRERVTQADLSHAFTFTGYVPYEQLPALYAQMSLFVAPVHRESFGQVTPFAMGMGLPVVGYRVGALGEIIDDPSLLCPSGDSEQLGRLIVELLDDSARRRAIGSRNRERALRLFTIEAMIAGYEALYSELIGTGPARPAESRGYSA